jgi:Trp operon repressor
MGQVVSVKEIELRLVAELLKDSHRSDRELAEALGVSQPTIARAILLFANSDSEAENIREPQYLVLQR